MQQNDANVICSANTMAYLLMDILKNLIVLS